MNKKKLEPRYSPIYLLTTLYVFTEINLGMVASHISEILLDGAWLKLWILIRVRGGRLTEMFRVKEIVLLHCLLSLQQVVLFPSPA